MALGPLASVVVAFWAMLPAYVPNNVAVLAGGGRPIDGGRTWHGDRLLGDGKTWRGTAAGTVAGTALALVLTELQASFLASTGIPVPRFTVLTGVALSLGAMLGDVGASFLKRRTGRERGKPFPGVDQLDFVVGALALAALVNLDWFVATFLEPPVVLGVVVVITPALHLVTNFLAFKLDLKSEPY
jgi:CDP-2,3-bis-(O-geranylgeranyl)-sn-glycerol synthase